MRTLQWPHHPPLPTWTFYLPAILSLGAHGLFLQHVLVAMVLFLHFPPRKRTPYLPCFFFNVFFFFFNNLSVSPESSSVRHWCPRNCPHQGHRGLPILHSTACLSSSSNRTDGWPVLPFGDVSQTFYCIPCTSVPFHSFHPPHSTASQALTRPLLFLWVTSLDALSQCPSAMPHPQMLLCFRA